MTDQTLSEQLANWLRRDILRGRRPPGTSIKERDTAADLGVSRTPMREAIRILAKEGLVVLRPSRSPIVARPSDKDVSDQAEVLLALEQLSAELACQAATDDEIAHIAKIADTMETQFDDTDPLDMFEIDMSFHTAIAKASHNDALAETHYAYLARLWRARHLAAVQRRNRDRVITQHGVIVRALRAREPAAARAAIHAHLGHLAVEIRAAMEQENTDNETAETATGDIT